MKKILFLLLSALLSQALFSQDNDLVNITDLFKIKQAGNITLSDDGSMAAFTVTGTEAAENKTDFKNITQVFMVPTDGSSPLKQLTFSKESATQPAWSPDAKQIAFVRNVDKKSQVFILDLGGGEAVQVTKLKYGASNPRWAPGGKHLIFSSSISLDDLIKDSMLNPMHLYPAWPLEKPGLDNKQLAFSKKVKPNPDGNIQEIRAYLEKNESDKKAQVLTKLNFQNESEVTDETLLTNFFVIDAKPDAEPIKLTRGFSRHNSIEFSPTGFVLSGNIDSLQHPDRVLENQLLIRNSNGDTRILLSKKNMSYTRPRISPKGKWVAFLYAPTSYVSTSGLAMIPITGTINDIITFPSERSIDNFVWSKDEKYIYYTAQSNGGRPLFRVNVSSKIAEQLSGTDSGIESFDIAGNKIVFVKTAIQSPSEIYQADTEMKNEKKVSDLNTWVKGKKISIPEKKTFINDKGMTIEYWVMKPVNHIPGKKYPLLLEIHGGPASMWGPGEASMWHEFQYFCSKGYGIVYSNPRGSGGYNETFRRGNINDWGTGPAKDVLTALDKTIKEGWADTTKLLITGGSYGGYMVAWIIARDKRFKAACSQRGVYDLATFYGEGNAWRLVQNYFDGSPFQPHIYDVLRRESPLTYVSNITTPYIIFHGENDRRTGFVQSEMLYRSLKDLGRPVEYVRHPGATHEITRSGEPRQRIDQLLRTFEFFERYIHR